MVRGLMSPHGPWLFLFHVFILCVGFIFKLLWVGWTSSQCHMQTQEQSASSPQERGNFPRHTPNTFPLIDQNWVPYQLLTQLLLEGMWLLWLAYKNYLRFNDCWDIYHPIYDRGLIPQISYGKSQKRICVDLSWLRLSTFQTNPYGQ